MIVGAGTIGLAAASATQRRCKVTVIELAATVMVCNARPPVQRVILLQRHQQAGVRILLNNAIEHVVDGEKVELTLQSGNASG